MSVSTEALVAKIAEALKNRAESLAVAESCTGGGIAQALTALPGSSAWFGFGFVTYANAAKVSLLGVTDASLDQYGAVSEQVAAQMAQGALLKATADWALSTTGIAGPDGGSADKPVGTVWFAWANKREIHTLVKYFHGDRAAIRQQATDFALQELLKKIHFTV